MSRCLIRSDGPAELLTLPDVLDRNVEHRPTITDQFGRQRAPGGRGGELPPALVFARVVDRDVEPYAAQ